MSSYIILKFTSSGTALIEVNPFLKTTVTLLAPQRRALVAQSKAVSPAPKTITLPGKLGSLVVLHPHIPGLEALETKGKNSLEV